MNGQRVAAGAQRQRDAVALQRARHPLRPGPDEAPVAQHPDPRGGLFRAQRLHAEVQVDRGAAGGHGAALEFDDGRQQRGDIALGERYAARPCPCFSAVFDHRRHDVGPVEAGKAVGREEQCPLPPAACRWPRAAVDAVAGAAVASRIRRAVAASPTFADLMREQAVLAP